MKTNRKYGLDLLRILSMMLITVIHFIAYTGVVEGVKLSDLNKIVLDVLYSLTTIGVNSFIMITGYFQSEKKLSYKKVFGLWINVVIVSAILLLVMLIMKEPISRMQVLKTFFPIATMHYWFLVQYIILMIASPLLNLLISFMTKRNHLYVCIFGFLIISVYYAMNPFVTEIVYLGNQRGILWFFYMYLVAAYIRKYDVFVKKGILISSTIFLLLIMSALRFCGYEILGQSKLLENYAVLPFLLTICIFLIFKRINVSGRYKRNFISALSACSFYVYIIQEHEAVRSWYWGLFDVTAHAEDIYFLALLLGSILILWPFAFIFEKLVGILKGITEKFYVFIQTIWLMLGDFIMDKNKLDKADKKLIDKK